jgi:citrate lyase beta subunit
MRSLLFAGATRPDLVAKLGRSGVAAVEFEGAMVDGPALRMAREVIERGGGR